MKKHPNADIEWYDDGMTMKEQEAWAKTHKIIRPKLQITERQQEQWKDKMISDLKMKLAANEEYIFELKNEIQEWEDKYNKEHEQHIETMVQHKNLWDRWSALNSKYSVDVNKYLHSEEFLSQYTDKYINKIKELEARVLSLTNARDELIYKLYHHDNV